MMCWKQHSVVASDRSSGDVAVCINEQVCIQDPNQDGPDSMEEPMSGIRCLMTTPTPPLVGGLDDLFTT